MRPKRNLQPLTVRISPELRARLDRMTDNNGLYLTQNIARMIELGMKVDTHVQSYLQEAFRKTAEGVIDDLRRGAGI